MGHNLFHTWDEEFQNTNDDENSNYSKNFVSNKINETLSEILETPNVNYGYVRCKLCKKIISTISFTFHLSAIHSNDVKNQNIEHLASFMKRPLDDKSPILEITSEQNNNINIDYNNEIDMANITKSAPVCNLSQSTLKPNNTSIYPLKYCEFKENVNENPSGVDHESVIAELEKIYSSNLKNLSKAAFYNLEREKNYGKLRDVLSLPGMAKSDTYSEFYEFADTNIKHMDNFNLKFLAQNDNIVQEIENSSFLNSAILNAARNPAIQLGKNMNIKKEKLIKAMRIFDKVLGTQESAEYQQDFKNDYPISKNDIFLGSYSNKEIPSNFTHNNKDLNFYSNSNVTINPINCYDHSAKSRYSRENTQSSEAGTSPIRMGKSKRNSQNNPEIYIDQKAEKASIKLNKGPKRKYNIKNKKTNNRGIYFFNIEQNMKSNKIKNKISLNTTMPNSSSIYANYVVNYDSPFQAIYNDSFHSEHSTTNNNSLKNIQFSSQNHIQNNNTSNNTFIYNSSNTIPDFSNVSNHNQIPIVVTPLNNRVLPVTFSQSNNVDMMTNDNIVFVKNRDNMTQAYEQINYNQNNPVIINKTNNCTNFITDNNLATSQISGNQNIQQNIQQNNIANINNQFNGFIQQNNISRNEQQDMNYIQLEMASNAQCSINENNKTVNTPHTLSYITTNPQGNIIGNMSLNMAQNAQLNTLNNKQPVIITPNNQPSMILKIHSNVDPNIQPTMNPYGVSNVCMVASNNNPNNMDGYIAVNPQLDSQTINQMDYSNNINSQINFQQNGQDNFQKNSLNDFQQPNSAFFQNNNVRFASNIIMNPVQNKIARRKLIIQQPANIVQRAIMPIQNITLMNGGQQATTINVPQNIQFIQNQSNHFSDQQTTFNSNQNFQNQYNTIGQSNITPTQYIIIPQGTANPNFVQNGRTFFQVSNNVTPQSYTPNIILVKPDPDYRYT